MHDIKKYTFSGHDTFQCRQLWLKKGYDFIKMELSFNAPDALVTLGVGKNMVTSIRYWLRAFNISDSNDQITEFGEFIFNDKTGVDPYLEDEATLWLLHYQLVKSGIASTYSLIFNEFRKERIEFSRSNYVSYIKRKSEIIKGIQFNANTIETDFDVFVKSYKRIDTNSKDKEDPYSGVLTELNILQRSKDDYYFIENTDKDEIPDTVVLYAILDYAQGRESLSLVSLEQDINSVGSIFAFSKQGLLNKIEALSLEKDKDYKMTFNDHACINRAN